MVHSVPNNMINDQNLGAFPSSRETAGKGNFTKTINKNVDSGKCLPLLEILALDQTASHTFRIAWTTLTYSKGVGGLLLKTKKS